MMLKAKIRREHMQDILGEKKRWVCARCGLENIDDPGAVYCEDCRKALRISRQRSRGIQA